MSMEVKGTPRLHRLFVCLLLLAIGLQPALAQNAPADDDPPDDTAAGTGLIKGKVFMTDAKNPVEGAIVHAYHLGSQQVFSSGPTDDKGRYEMGGLPFGYADLFVETPDGVFVANQVESVPPAITHFPHVGSPPLGGGAAGAGGIATTPSSSSSSSSSSGVAGSVCGRRASDTAGLSPAIKSTRPPARKFPSGARASTA